MSFLKGEPQIASEQDVKSPWLGMRNGNGFRCHLCGYRFKIGDYWRCQFTNNIPGAGGNPLFCKSCDDTPEIVIGKWKARCDEWRKFKTSDNFWWFTRNENRN